MSDSYNIGPRAVGSWRGQAIGMWRIVFGLVWAIDASFKWKPAFQKDFVSYLTGALDGQPALAKDWIGFWIDIVKVDPHVVALIVTGAETALAVALILGVFRNIADLGGVTLAFVIWSTAEGFGGPTRLGRPTSAPQSSMLSCSSDCSCASRACISVSTAA